MVPRNSSLRAHPADTSTGCAVCVLSSFQRTRSSRDPRPFDPAVPHRVGALTAAPVVVRGTLQSYDGGHMLSTPADDKSRRLLAPFSTTLCRDWACRWSAFQRPGPLILRV